MIQLHENYLIEDMGFELQWKCADGRGLQPIIQAQKAKQKYENWPSPKFTLLILIDVINSNKRSGLGEIWNTWLKQDLKTTVRSTFQLSAYPSLPCLSANRLCHRGSAYLCNEEILQHPLVLNPAGKELITNHIISSIIYSFIILGV